MAFHPFMLRSLLAVLNVKPSGKAGRSESRRINGKINFDRFQRQTGLCNECSENWSQCRVFKVIEDRVVMRNARGESLRVGIAQITHEPSSGNRRIDLERRAEYCVRQWQTRPTAPLRLRLSNPAAKIEQQGLKLVFLLSLSSIVSRPLLRIGSPLRGRHGHGLSNGRTAIVVLFASHHVRSCEDMLAFDATCLVIQTRARRLFAGHIDPIIAGSGLRRDNPCIALLVYVLCRCQHQAALLSQVVHRAPRQPESILLVRYIPFKEIVGDISLDGIFLSGISLASYGAHDDQTTGLPLFALRARMGATQEHQRRTSCLPEVQIAVLESAQKAGKIRVWGGWRGLNPRPGINSPLPCRLSYSHHKGAGEESAFQTFAPHSLPKESNHLRLSKWNVLVLNLWLPSVKDSSILFFAINFCRITFRQATQNLVYRSHLRSQTREVVTLFEKQLTNIVRRQSLLRISEDESYRVSESQFGNVPLVVIGDRKVGEGGKVIQNLVETRDFGTEFSQFCFKVISKRRKVAALPRYVLPCLREIIHRHNSGA